MSTSRPEGRVTPVTLLSLATHTHVPPCSLSPQYLIPPHSCYLTHIPPARVLPCTYVFPLPVGLPSTCAPSCRGRRWAWLGYLSGCCNEGAATCSALHPTATTIHLLTPQGTKLSLYSKFLCYFKSLFLSRGARQSVLAGRSRD